MNYELIVTDDGSHSVRIAGSGVTFHSVHGAVRESQTVFINAGLRHPDIASLHELHILEIGFGTGLNALLTLVETESTAQLVRYEAVEPFPLTETFFKALNYCNHLQRPDLQDAFLRMHEAAPERETFVSSRFCIIKRLSVEEIPTGTLFNLVYFDAFAPGDQPELWTKEVFTNIFRMCTQPGIFVTYSSKGLVRKTLESAGFEVEKLPGPPGKKEITRAVKPASGKFMA